MKNVHSGVRPLVIQLLATSFMTGLIWFVQVVHYPLMEGWPHDDFGSWEAAHREHTGPVVIPPMLIEGVVAVWLLMHRPRGVNPFLPVLGIIALLGIWGSTFFLQVPCHLQLSTGLGRSNTPFSCHDELDSDNSLVIPNGPFCRDVLAVLAVA